MALVFHQIHLKLVEKSKNRLLSSYKPKLHQINCSEVQISFNVEKQNGDLTKWRLVFTLILPFHAPRLTFDHFHHFFVSENVPDLSRLCESYFYPNACCNEEPTQSNQFLLFLQRNRWWQLSILQPICIKSNNLLRFMRKSIVKNGKVEQLSK